MKTRQRKKNRRITIIGLLIVAIGAFAAFGQVAEKQETVSGSYDPYALVTELLGITETQLEEEIVAG